MLYAPGTSLGAELRQVGVAFRLDQHFSKKTILALYLDASYFGDGAYGVVQAASHYFELAPSQLSWAQASLLAGLVQAPSEYDPHGHFSLARQRQSHVLARLVATHRRSQPARLRPPGTPRSTRRCLSSAEDGRPGPDVNMLGPELRYKSDRGRAPVVGANQNGDVPARPPGMWPWWPLALSSGGWGSRRTPCARSRRRRCWWTRAPGCSLSTRVGPQADEARAAGRPAEAARRARLITGSLGAILGLPRRPGRSAASPCS